MLYEDFGLFMLGLAGMAAASFFSMLVYYRRSKKWKNYRCTQPVSPADQ